MGMAIKIGGLTIPGSHGSGLGSSYWVTIKSGVIWYKREINTTDGYFALHYSDDSGLTWDEILKLDITEDNPVIDLLHLYRHRIVVTAYQVDRTLTPVGYSGIENTDWENIYTT